MRFRKLVADFLQNVRSVKRKVIIKLTTDRNDIKHLKIDSNNFKKVWYGTSYGGFFIIPSLLNLDSIVYSFGIGTDISFDKKCIAKHNCKIFAFDPTPKSIQYIKSLRLSNLFQFHEIGIAPTSGMETFFMPASPRAVSGSLYASDVMNTESTIQVEVKSLKDIANQLGHTKIDVLKMDIEGMEYEVIENILDSGIQIVQLLIEFHDRMFPMDYPRSQKIVEKLRSNGYKLFGVSASYEEVSFVHDELAKGRLH